MITLGELLQQKETAARPTLKTCQECGFEYFLFHTAVDCAKRKPSSSEEKEIKKDKHPNRDRNNQKGNRR